MPTIRNFDAEGPPIRDKIRDKMKISRATDWWSSDGAVPTESSNSSDTRCTRRWRGSSNAPCRGCADGMCPALHNSDGNGWRLLGRAALLGPSQRPVQESRADFGGVKLRQWHETSACAEAIADLASDYRDSLLIPYIIGVEERGPTFLA